MERRKRRRRADRDPRGGGILAARSDRAGKHEVVRPGPLAERQRRRGGRKVGTRAGAAGTAQVGPLAYGTRIGETTGCS